MHSFFSNSKRISLFTIILIAAFSSYSEGIPNRFTQQFQFRINSNFRDDLSKVSISLFPTGAGLKLISSSSPDFHNKEVLNDFSTATLDPGVGFSHDVDLSQELGESIFFAFESTFREGPLVQIDPGTFTMGSPESEYNRNSNENLHEVTITRSFKIEPMKTVAYQMAAVMQWALENEKIEVVEGIVYNLEGERRPLLDTTVSSGGFGNHKPGSRIKFADGYFSPRQSLLTFHPLYHATWFGAICYANYRSEIEGLTPAYDLNDWTCNFDSEGYRLPTEAEWEYACRAGTTTMYNNGADTYNTIGANINQHIVHVGNNMRYYYTQPAGAHLPNNWGLYNMASNGMEWCWDVYEEQLDGPVADPKGLELQTFDLSARVIRSQSAEAPADFVRSAIRRGRAPSNAAAGFRLVRTIPTDE